MYRGVVIRLTRRKDLPLRRTPNKERQMNTHTDYPCTTPNTFHHNDLSEGRPTLDPPAAPNGTVGTTIPAFSASQGRHGSRFLQDRGRSEHQEHSHPRQSRMSSKSEKLQLLTPTKLN